VQQSLNRNYVDWFDTWHYCNKYDIRVGRTNYHSPLVNVTPTTSDSLVRICVGKRDMHKIFQLEILSFYRLFQHKDITLLTAPAV
jgi:hypothetical protein